MNKLRVPQGCFHKWLILIKFFQDIHNWNNFCEKKEFYELYFKCWVLENPEGEINKLTLKFLEDTDLKIILSTKEFYWEYSEKEQNWNDSEKWIWMYNTIQQMLSKEKDDLKRYFKLNYSQEEMQWQSEWPDELPD
jgi:hypothetical protein